MEDDILSAIEPVIDRFDALGIRYQIGGSVASSVYGVARSTVDVDMLANLPTDLVDPWIEGLQDRYYVARERAREAAERQTSFNIIHLETMIKVDIFVSTTDSYNQECLRRSRRESLTESPRHQVLIASPEDVVLHKLMWYRKGGETSERQWSDVLGVLKVQGSGLDLPYMKDWAQRLEVSDLLERVIQDAAPST